MRSPYQAKSHSKGFSQIVLVVSGVAVLAILVITTLELTGKIHLFHKRTMTAPSASQYTKGETGSSTSSTGTSSTQSSTSVGSQQYGSQKNTGDDTSTLITPSGLFVSNHHPNLSGSPAPNEINSVCTTTPGATCRIEFTKDEVTKSLSSQVTDAGGSAYWNWKLQDIGLTQGEWTVTARATLGSQSATAQDALKLDVQP